jgi:hypothetical protein
MTDERQKALLVGIGTDRGPGRHDRRTDGHFHIVTTIRPNRRPISPGDIADLQRAQSEIAAATKNLHKLIQMLYDDGVSVRSIGRALGISGSSVHYLLKKQ